MGKSRLAVFIWFIIVVSISAHCQFRIAVSKTSASYENWLKQADSSVVPINMYDLGIDSALLLMDSCKGLLLTGGEDVYPGYYGKLNEIGRCEEIDRYRDSLEFALIRRALDLKMPVFGICRGEQILNVFLGGTLLIDIPTDADTVVKHRCPAGSPNCLHGITIDRQSLLFAITAIHKGTVNSYHHQAAEKIAPGMKATAVSGNGIVEAIERIDSLALPFIMGVQWHPERLEQHPELALPLADYFLKKTREYKMNIRIHAHAL